MSSTTLEACTCANTPLFSLNGREFRAKVVNVYDGDTITCVIELFPDRFFQFKFRLLAIDTPEMVGEHSASAVVARNRVIQLITKTDTTQEYMHMRAKDIRRFFSNHNYYVHVKCHHFDKYGRVLAEVYADDNLDESINRMLVSENLAVNYG